MSALLLSLATFFSTLVGGLFGLRYRDHLNLIMGFTAGVLVGLVSFDLLPEIFRLVYTLHLDSTGPMLALMGGFLLFHIVEKSILIHFSHEEQYAVHQHPLVGVLSAVALTGHSFLDGVGIGLGFQVSAAVGLPYYLGFFAGFLLYLGASDILPQAHSNKSTAFTLALTVLGVVFAFVVTRFV